VWVEAGQALWYGQSVRALRCRRHRRRGSALKGCALTGCMCRNSNSSNPLSQCSSRGGGRGGVPRLANTDGPVPHASPALMALCRSAEVAPQRQWYLWHASLLRCLCRGSGWGSGFACSRHAHRQRRDAAVGFWRLQGGLRPPTYKYLLGWAAMVLSLVPCPPRLRGTRILASFCTCCVCRS
jgi:hypothetical protein